MPAYNRFCPCVSYLLLCGMLYPKVSSLRNKHLSPTDCESGIQEWLSRMIQVQGLSWGCTQIVSEASVILGWWSCSRLTHVHVGKPQFLTTRVSSSAPECSCSMAAGFPSERVILEREKAQDRSHSLFNILLHLRYSVGHANQLWCERGQFKSEYCEAGVAGSLLEGGLP